MMYYIAVENFVGLLLNIFGFRKISEMVGSKFCSFF